MAVPTWLCRVESPEGAFLREAGIHKQWVTSSGYMTCVTADGKLLGTSPTPKVLQKYFELPEIERRPGLLKIPDLEASEKVIPDPPADGMVLRVHARFLAGDNDGKLRHAETTDFPLLCANPPALKTWKQFLQPNTEYMWLTKNEWQALVPSDPKPGQSIAFNPLIAERLARFHLTPQRATTSEGGIVSKQSVKEATLTARITKVSDNEIHMDVTGKVHWGSDFDPAKATTPNGPLKQGFTSSICGRLIYDRQQNRFARFDLLAPGEIWGRWGDANGKSMYVERPGKTPFGFALELATGDSPTDRIPPGGNGRYISQQSGYFGPSMRNK